MSKGIKRRDFIRLSTGLATGMGLAGCSVFDPYFSSDKRQLDDEVLIVGAGAAGLAAAYELKKKKIGFRIYESNARAGGRVHSLYDLNEDHQFAELGAEFFAKKNRRLVDLCEELRLPIDEIEFPGKLEAQMYLVKGKLFSQRELHSKFKPLTVNLIKSRLSVTGDSTQALSALNQDVFERASLWDQLSAYDLVKRFSENLSPELVTVFLNSLRCQFGVEPERMSCLQMLNAIDLGDRDTSGNADALLRIRGGNERLTRVLLERVSGILPNYLVRFETPLLRIYEDGNYFRCHFIGKNSQVVRTKYLILAMPVNQYINIDGLTDLKMSEKKKLAVYKQKLGQLSKGILSFKEKFWLNKSDRSPANRGQFILDNLALWTWDSSLSQEGKRGLMSFVRAGSFESNTREELLKEMSNIYPNLKPLVEEGSWFVNWGQRSHINGSAVFYGPGDFMNFHGIWSQADYGGRLQYAGEHCHLTEYGTLNGAIESGTKAASLIAEMMQEGAKS